MEALLREAGGSLRVRVLDQRAQERAKHCSPFGCAVSQRERNTCEVAGGGGRAAGAGAGCGAGGRQSGAPGCRGSFEMGQLGGSEFPTPPLYPTS